MQECEQQYEYLIHPEKYSKVTSSRDRKHSRPSKDCYVTLYLKKEAEEKHRRRILLFAHQ